MIQTNDLRVGNIVMAKTTEMKKWLSPYTLDKGYFQMFLEGTVDVKPIPLTAKILNRCGFKKETRGEKDDFDGVEIVYNKDGIDIYDHTEDGAGFSYATYTRYPSRGFKSGYGIKSLHQLQNLYHSLTGKELSLDK